MRRLKKKELKQWRFREYRFTLIFEPRDLWIGVFWDGWKTMDQTMFEVYVIIIPTLPLKIVRIYEPGKYRRNMD